ncbi:hypothetical protein RRU01S_13_01150 [Agrobacterium rubi TR3 = NBRC 13261]|uniref:SHOCT domain-containing protein n=1 Tax=Agrobacterium rubi TR3 = NBRC 13261 TaxID=1368415 RepID=A0A081CVT1_9HYPH|nr:hypothetical protein [Agrobacterium rubi]MBP1877740.1 hypothetical protein [Agrobacterium rubi]MCL6652068.1 hypothetical protein [Agrobacterium rubi]GAK70777.1 hypothetical protein RRU01S_13_01150 [Agrobacterium rubi TR3 = NBRC 13261]
MGKRMECVRAATALSVCGLLLPLLGACKTLDPIVAPAHMKRPAAQVVGPQSVDASPMAQKRDTGTYPTFAKPMTAALPQMENDEADSMQTSMTKLGAARRRGQISEVEYKRRVAELRALQEQQKPVATPAASQ